MKTTPPEEEVRLRFLIAILKPLGSLLQNGYSRKELGKRLDRVVRAFNAAMYQRVIQSRKTGALADTVLFHVNLGTEVVRVVVRVNPTDEHRVTMDLVGTDRTQALSFTNN